MLRSRSFLKLSLLVFAACSSAPRGESSGSGGEHGSGGSTASTSTSSDDTGGGGDGGDGGSGGAVECPAGPGYATGPSSTEVGTIDITVLDLADAPVSGAFLQLCGLDICLTAKTDSIGKLAFAAKQSIDTPILKMGGFKYGHTGIPVTAGDSSLTLRVGELLGGTELVAGQTAEAGGARLRLDAETHIEIDPVTYPSPDNRLFRAVMLPAEPDLVGDSGIELVYSLAPAGAVFCPPATLDLPNSAGWAANESVRFYVFGQEIDQEWTRYGKWSYLSDGSVSADGERVTTSAGQGLPTVGLVGVARALGD